VETFLASRFIAMQNLVVQFSYCARARIRGLEYLETLGPRPLTHYSLHVFIIPNFVVVYQTFFGVGRGLKNSGTLPLWGGSSLTPKTR